MLALPPSKEKRERAREKAGCVSATDQLFPGASFSAGLEFLWGSRAAGTVWEGEGESNTRGEFLAAPEDSDSFW